jgi:Na+-transporting NADH:ubiquinone oxidoreductase subunit A
MTRIVKIKRGLNIRLKGEAEKKLEQYKTNLYSVQPSEFRVFNPRLLVAEGDIVEAGSKLVQEKSNENLVLTSPVSGKVIEIRRGEKRKLEHIIIESDGKGKKVNFGVSDAESLDREVIVNRMLDAGVWPMIRQRPFAVIANPAQVPDTIFISGFDTAPLAPDFQFIMQQHDPALFQAGIDILKKLTAGPVHLNVHPKLGIPDVFLHTKNVQINQFYGPHPVSNVGIQIHHIRPVMKGDVIWYVDPQDVVVIGRLFMEGIYFPEKIFAVTGSELKSGFYFKALSGFCIESLLTGNLVQENVRVISGNVLTGTKTDKNGFSGFYEKVITVMPEGDYFEFIGWALPGLKKFSMSKTYLSWLFRNRKYRLDTNKHGEERAFVVTGEYEKVFPMNILPVLLLKAIIVKDFELMEQLGIYEVAEEDFALCEVICTSKIESQAIVREGIDFMLKETN